MVLNSSIITNQCECGAGYGINDKKYQKLISEEILPFKNTALETTKENTHKEAQATIPILISNCEPKKGLKQQIQKKILNIPITTLAVSKSLSKASQSFLDTLKKELNLKMLTVTKGEKVFWVRYENETSKNGFQVIYENLTQAG